jgi:hypothetical protein
MAGYYHEPVVHPNCLYGKEVLEPVIPGPESGRLIPTLLGHSEFVAS